MAKYNFPETLVGDSVILEKLDLFHAEDFYKAIDNSRQHISRWVTWLTPEYELKDLKEFIEIKHEQFLEQEVFSYVITDKETEEVLGSIDLIIKAKGAAELGYYLVESATGKGIIAEAIDLLVEFAFEETKILRISLDIETDNIASIKSATKQGFVFEGTVYNQQYDSTGKVLDILKFVKLKDKSVMTKLKEIEPKLIDLHNIKYLKNK